MKIIIVDDHFLIGEMLKGLILEHFQNAEINIFSNVDEALDFVTDNESINFIISDIDMPGKSGLEFCDEVKAVRPSIKFVFLTMHSNDDVIKYAIYKKASGFLIKENSSIEIIKCIEFLLNNENSFFLGKVNSPLNNIKTKNEPLIETLTKTERKVIKLIAQKYNSQEISQFLCITTNSVENYRNRICKKLELENRHNSLLIWAIENKILL